MSGWSAGRTLRWARCSRHERLGHSGTRRFRSHLGRLLGVDRRQRPPTGDRRTPADPAGALRWYLLAAPLCPNPVIVRLSDFKTNEDAALVGGQQFEPTEENPMLGWRGASRYYDDGYRDGFDLECQDEQNPAVLRVTPDSYATVRRAVAEAER